MLIFVLALLFLYELAMSDTEVDAFPVDFFFVNKEFCCVKTALNIHNYHYYVSQLLLLLRTTSIHVGLLYTLRPP